MLLQTTHCGAHQRMDDACLCGIGMKVRCQSSDLAMPVRSSIVAVRARVRLKRLQHPSNDALAKMASGMLLALNIWLTTNGTGQASHVELVLAVRLVVVKVLKCWLATFDRHEECRYRIECRRLRLLVFPMVKFSASGRVTQQVEHMLTSGKD